MVFVECNPDVVLVQQIGRVPRKNILHELKGKGEICARLSRTKGGLALLDEDPDSNQPPYLGRLSLYEDVQGNYIRILHDQGYKNYVILLMPRLEDWILRAAKFASIDVAHYNLPGNPRDLHTVINSRLNKFEQLVAHLMKERSPMLGSLKVALLALIKTQVP